MSTRRITPRKITRREARALDLSGRAAGIFGVYRPNPDASTAESYATTEARVTAIVVALAQCVTEAEDALHQERTRRVQAEALLAQLTTPSPTTPEPEAVPL